VIQRVPGFVVPLITATVLSISASAAAQTSGQLWVNVTLDWIKASGVTYEIDLEPKVQVSAPPGEPGWGNIDVTPSIEYALAKFVDVLGELTVGRTRQTDDLKTTEVTARGGLRFHLFSRQHRLLMNEALPNRRLVLRDLVRVESRNFFYSDGSPTDSTIRFRNRLEFLVPLNRQNLGDDGALSAQADWEWFVPVSDPEERFASRQRIRAGLSYRQSVNWRFAALYIRNRSRDTTSESFETSEDILNFQIRRVW
jgi:hypothetical protein